MSTNIGHWEITNDYPQRSARAGVDFEARLEDWIERDPTLLRADLRIVGRQLSTEGGPLDLLAIGLQGKWVVIEIKRGQVNRDTVAQAIDYSSCIRSMPEDELKDAVAEYLREAGQGSLEELREQYPEAFDAERDKREVEMIVVGTSRDAGLERMIKHLQESGNIAVSVVTFDVFKVGKGTQVLVRELTEMDEPPRDKPLTANRKQNELCQTANALGIGDAFKRILKLADAHGLKKRVSNKSIMYAPPSDGRRVLFLVYGSEKAKNGGLLVFSYPPAFEEFLNVKAAKVTQAIGFDGWAGLETKSSVEKFIRGLESLLHEALPVGRQSR